MRTQLLVVATVAVLGAFGGCATQAVTVKQSIAIANKSLESANDTVRRLYCPDPPACQLGTISREQAVKYRERTYEAGTALDLATAAIATGNTAEAATALDKAEAILLELRRQGVGGVK